MRIAILGAGAWGTAVAASAALRNSAVLYGRDAAQVAALRASRENAKYLPGIALPKALSYTDDFAEAVRAGADLTVVATPVAGLRPACAALQPFAPRRIVWLCKGFEQGSGLLPHEVAAAELPGIPVGVLSGPSFAEEVARGLPTALTIATPDPALADVVTEAFHGDGMRIYGSEDMVGAEIGGAVKNVLAIATGIADGLELGMNARAALITRGLSEMMRFGLALGGQAETLMGLTGLGDLILTCTGALSRNRRVGLALAQGKPLERILAELGHVAEGVHCAATVLGRARKLGIEMPITEAVCKVMFEGLAPVEAVQILLDRSPKSEQSGLL